MNQDLFKQAVKLASMKLLGPEGAWTQDGTTCLEGDDLIAYALLSASGSGPWEEQAKQLKDFAHEREERFCAIRWLLDTVGIGTEAGKLEDQVLVLVERDRLRRVRRAP